MKNARALTATTLIICGTLFVGCGNQPKADSADAPPSPASSGEAPRPSARDAGTPSAMTSRPPRPRPQLAPVPSPVIAADAPMRRAEAPRPSAGAMGATMGAGMMAPPFAVPVRARHRQGHEPEVEIERQKDLGDDSFALSSDGKSAALIVNGRDFYDLTQTQINALNRGLNIWVTIDEEHSGKQVSVEAYVPMVDAKRRRTGVAQYSAQLQVPNTSVVTKTPKPKPLDGVRPAGTTVEIDAKKQK